ncbi:hypothetical protein WR25_06095 [Diploscapter pachys]|uniref:Uncharacterized protein n=1 Tax=Diploscapter pachys TaxID=2018661 RepID=A0A2A2M0L1_9BILA|nr:hypothetical protein WR25_06095 [Diploscapter pachys]
MSNILPTVLHTKRFSVPRQLSERRVTIRPFDSFRERRDDPKQRITFGYAALSCEAAQRKKSEADGNFPNCPPSPSPSIFSIYGDNPGPSTICEQPTGAQADVFIASLSEKSKEELRKFIKTAPPAEERMYFVWIRDIASDKPNENEQLIWLKLQITIVSLKNLENNLSNKHRIRRVKWRHLSAERESVYRYSIPALTLEKSQMLKACILRNKKITLIVCWLIFVMFLCLLVIVGSLNPNQSQSQFNVTIYNSTR